MDEYLTKKSIKKVLIFIFAFMLIGAFVFGLPTFMAMCLYHEDSFITRIDDRIPDEPVKSITNKFVEGAGFGGAGGLASTDIETSSVDQFLEKTAGEKIYSTYSLKYDTASFDPYPNVFIKTYVSLIKDRSGVYTYIEKYRYEGYLIKDFDGETIHWYKDNAPLCIILWVVVFFVAIFVTFKTWKFLDKRKLLP